MDAYNVTAGPANYGEKAAAKSGMFVRLGTWRRWKRPAASVARSPRGGTVENFVLECVDAVRHLGHANRADRIRKRRLLRGQNFDLPQLRNDLFRLVLLRHLQSSSMAKPYFESDHFIEGGSHSRPFPS
jgi:hypothetical protein